MSFRWIIPVIIFLASPVYADVYLDQELSRDQSDGLAEFLPRALAPGGTRKISVNGNEMLVKRLVSGRSKDGGKVLDEVQKRYDTSASSEILRIALEKGYIELEQELRSVQEAEPLIEQADQIVAMERALIVEEIEQPRRYHSGIWDVLSRIPIKSIQPTSKLGRLAPEDGFIYMAELPSRDKSPVGAYWEIKFMEDFHLGSILNDFEGDAPGNDMMDVNRYPGSRRTLTYVEEANNWTSRSWSYQSRGSVPAHLNHYVREYERLGYRQDEIEYHQRDESLVQLRKQGRQVALYVVNTHEGREPIQITIQESGS